MSESEEPHVHSLEGTFVVAVGNAVGMEIDPDEGAGVASDASRVFRITLVAPSLAHTVEVVDLSREDIDATKRTLYMIQRGSAISEREAMPASHDDTYDVICYIDDWLKSQEDEEWERVFEERKESERYQTSPPEWVENAMNS